MPTPLASGRSSQKAVASKSSKVKSSGAVATGQETSAKSPAKSKASAAKVVPPTPAATPIPEPKASRRPRTAKTPVAESVAPRAVAAPRKSTRSEHASAPKPGLLQGDLPESYGRDRLVAIPKDPDWTHLYWEVSEETRRQLGDSGALRLRGFDTTGVLFDGANAPVALDIEVAPFARSWYVKLPYQGRVYTFEYGTVDGQGEWRGVLRSQPVGFEPGMLPFQAGSEEWISIASDELFRAAAGLEEGEGIQDLIRRLRQRSDNSGAMGGAAWLSSWGSGMGRLELAPSSWGGSSFEQALGFAPSSWSTTSIGSGVSWSGLAGAQLQPPRGRDKDFWLWVETELILYGATEPDAQVTLMGRPIKLNPDGTFRVHFPFPHATELHMDVRAVDKTGEQVREAKPAARRWTE